MQGCASKHPPHTVDVLFLAWDESLSFLQMRKQLDSLQ